MSKILTAQVAGHYYGAQVAQMLGKTQVVGLMVGLANDFIRIHTKGGSLSSWAMNNCKLVLTPLTKITDDHAIEVAKIDSGYNENAEDARYFMIMDGMSIIKNWGINIHIHSGNSMTMIADFLRSNSYDCDGLIESGIAISSLDLTEAK